MRGAVCEREQDILDALAANRWPDRLGVELSAHLAECPICADLASVAQAIAEDYESASVRARLPSAGLVWWRAEIRARQEAGRAASRPITVVQVISAACGIGLALALLFWSGFGPLLSIGSDFWGALAKQPFLLPQFYLAIGVLVVLASLALYLALSDE